MNSGQTLVSQFLEVVVEGGPMDMNESPPSDKAEPEFPLYVKEFQGLSALQERFLKAQADICDCI